MVKADNTYSYAQLAVLDDAIERCKRALIVAALRGDNETYDSVQAQLGALQAQRARLGVLAQQLQEQG